MNELMKVFEFESYPRYFWKERGDVKNNTIRKIDLYDDRFLNLIAWAETGWNDGEIQIRIENTDSYESFVRDIRDITIWDDLIIITWNPHKKL